MKLPTLTKMHSARREHEQAVPGGVTPQGCDIGCLLTKAPHCIPKLLAGDYAGFLLCAGSAAIECCR